MKNSTVIVLTPRGRAYASYRKRAAADCRAQGEHPITLDGAEDDTVVAGVSRWLELYDRLVVYEDYGWTEMSRDAVNEAESVGADVEFRTLDGVKTATIEDRFRAAH